VPTLHALRLRPRLGLAVLAGFLVTIPLTLLAFSVRTGSDLVRDIDRSVTDELHSAVAHEPWAVQVLKAIAVIFDPWVFRAAVGGLVLVLLSRRAFRLAWWAAITMTAGSVLGFALKLVVARARPSFDTPAATAPGFSFPSGHALNSSVAVLVILLVIIPALPGRSARATAWSVGGSIVFITGFDRVALGVHYPTDVLAGWLVAAALVATTAAAVETWRRDTGRPPHRPIQGVDPDDAGRLT
jgi:membrane-associated phospholipid phosphatase